MNARKSALAAYNPIATLREVARVAQDAQDNTQRLERLMSSLKFMLVVSRYDSVVPPDVVDRLGGIDKVFDGVEMLYERITLDPELSSYFVSLSEDEMAYLIQQQAKMLIAIIGAGDFLGRPLALAHYPHRITEAHFEKLLGHVIAVLPRIGLMPDEVDAIVSRLRTFKPQIINSTEGVQ